MLQLTALHKHNYNTDLLSMAFYNITTNCFTNIIITQTYLVWPFTIPQLADLDKHNYNTDLLSMAFYNTTTNFFYKHNDNTDLLSMAFYNTTTN